MKQAAAEFPVVTLVGPRQSGKTTLLQHLFSPSHRYVSLEAPDVRAAAAADPRGFLAAYAPPAILDEIQHAPQLLPYVKEKVDAERSKRGQYLLTGSQNLLLMETVTESLAGRTAVLRLLPLSHREARGHPDARLPWEGESPRPVARSAPGELWEAFLRGGYPELVTNPRRDARLWHGSYIQTYLERDVRLLRQVGDLSLFQNFLHALAARSASLLNLTELARDLGVAVNTAKAWLSVLEASFQVIVLRPYFANVSKRLVKTPKVYFTDVGTLCYLSGLRDPEHAAAGPMGGAILETAVVSEVEKAYVHRGEVPRLWFWRSSAGTEVDLLVETDRALIPIEVKLSGTPRPAMAAGIARLRSDLGSRVGPGYVVHPGDVTLPIAPGVTALPFGSL
ncbi:MAG: ATP-binding protein [Thermotogota bacterium]